jgi:hypothetical protein
VPSLVTDFSSPVKLDRQTATYYRYQRAPENA